VSIEKGLPFDTFEKKSGSLARRVQQAGHTDDDDKVLGGKMQIAFYL
jgi:hypothetical protein